MEFKRYKELVEKYYQNDCRELNFRKRCIIARFVATNFS